MSNKSCSLFIEGKGKVSVRTGWNEVSMTFAMRSRLRPISSRETKIAKRDLRVRRLGDE